MEAAEETLTYRDDTGLYRKLHMNDMKEKDHMGDSEGRPPQTNSDESNYVDLDMKPDGPKTVKVTFTGDGNHASVSKQVDHETISESASEDLIDLCEEGPRADKGQQLGPGSGSGPVKPPLETLTKLSKADQDSEAELERSDCSEAEELQYTDMCRNSTTESVLSDTVEDESHYITTHEIQLAELDHDADYDLGRGTRWEFEDDNLVYSFVDYASFESDDTQEGTLILEGRSLATVQSNLGGPVVSTEPEESDLCASSDESECKHQREDTNAGEIHLSIKTSSRAVTDPISVFDSTSCGYTQPSADRSHYALVNPGARPAPLCDRAQYFIPAPGRQHLPTKLRRKDINEYSSGASSSISELDDADKEVRNLTAKSFRSLACPYFDAINLSTSSESSVSELGLNKWSAYVDWNYGNVSRGSERSVIAHKTSSATLEMNNSLDNKLNGKSLPGIKATPTTFYAFNQRTTSQQASSYSKHIHPQPAQRGVTLNFRCVEGGRGSKSSRKVRSGQVTDTVLARSGCKMQYHTDSVGESHKKAIFASSLLKNVISKKMQFEQERKMERGEICDTYPAASPCFQIRDHDGVKDKTQGRGLQRQTSETGSAFTVSSADDQRLERSRLGSFCSAEENSKAAAEEEEKAQNEAKKVQLIHSQGSAFSVLKEAESGSGKDPEPSHESDTQPPSSGGQDTSSMLTKLVFVPSCQLVSNDPDLTEDLTGHEPATEAPVSPQECEKELKTTNSGNTEVMEGKDKGGKTPEIKICLRSLKENRGCTLNIASLLTPKISYNVNTLRATDNSKCHILSAADRVPSFTVRDIRENKYKLQTPIYQVRDVRKLVKSCYRFVSLDNSENKSSIAADKAEEKVKNEPGKHVLPSPIVIKCNSVKTKSQTATTPENLTEIETVPEVSHSDNRPHCVTNKEQNASAKQQGHPDHAEIQPNLDKKPAKHRQDKQTNEPVERRNEPTIPKQDALEKLKAAVKTMEQLYVFDRNEWKRKSQTPRPIADSHVLSHIAREKPSVEEPGRSNINVVPQNGNNTPDPGITQGVNREMNIIHLPYNSNDIKAQQSKTFTNKSILHFGNKANISVSSNSKLVPQSSLLQASSALKSFKTPAAPLCVKTEPPKQSLVEQGKVKVSVPNPTLTQGCPDSENYLTIPGLRNTNEVKELNQECVSDVSKNNVSVSTAPEQIISPLTIYHHPTAAGPQRQQQVLHISPCAPTLSPTSPTDTAPQMQRKMLLDPTTGHYYLVDTPIQATTKRLFDPETGQYVEVPMSHSPVSPVTPVTPVPLSLSPLALAHPTGYAPAYMIYPSFIPSPSLAAQVLLPPSPCHSEDLGGEHSTNARGPRLETIPSGTESVQYSTVGGASQGPLHLPVSFGHMTTKSGTLSSERKPVISITTQQGPRIIAPPSFDGTTMSFVVEHR
ncbi:uncharacterized protein C4orf54 homolog [Gouania willdenowi]|uniref:uncharacterized protein C4orf54 homolog n=1 Tax=Gouania willdenowi TaxID=441366 RepID=UPI00105583E9|nr:uncharacterized protein C4orf54-like [Gouania willdenowi]